MLLTGFLVSLGGGPGCGLQGGGFPADDALLALDGVGGRLGAFGGEVTRVSPDCDGLRFGKAELDRGLAGDCVAGSREAFLAPELAGGFGVGADDAGLPLEGVADAEAADRNLLLLEVGVEGRFAGDLGGLLDGLREWRFDNRAVAAAHADVMELDFLGIGGEGHADYAEVAQRSFRLHGDGESDFAEARAVRAVGVDGVFVLDDERLGRERIGSRRFLRWKRKNESRQRGREQQGTGEEAHGELFSCIADRQPAMPNRS